MELDLQLPEPRPPRSGGAAGQGVRGVCRAGAQAAAPARGVAAPCTRTGTAPAVPAVPPAPSAQAPVPAAAPAAPGGHGGVRRGGGRRAAPRRGPVPPSRDALARLRQAADQLAQAHHEPEPVRRYPAAYLAALRAGAAVLAMRARPRPRRGAPRDVWGLLAEVAPELGEWASFFASCSRTRTAAEAGIDRLVDRRAADDLLRQAEQFVARVQLLLPR
nr:SAV_6107 family HEPN domain-containing protein [Pseudonocardia sp. EC080625-04]